METDKMKDNGIIINFSKAIKPFHLKKNSFAFTERSLSGI